MTAPTLPEFLLARIAEDESLAQAAGGVAWHATYLDGRKTREEPKWIVDSDPRLVSYEMTTEANAKHAEAWSPARAIDECLVKRMVAEAHEGWHVCPNSDGRGYTDHHDGSNADDADGELCPTLLMLAAVYADHPDYDEAWRP